MARHHDVVHTATYMSRRRRLDRFELAALGAFAALSAWLLAVLLWRATRENLLWSGTDGLGLGDQMQYLNWIRDAADHGLISNRYRLEDTEASFVHPLLLLSAGLHLLGASPSVAYLVWKPVAVVALFLAVRAYGHRLLDTTARRRWALVLALFFVTPAGHLAELAGASTVTRGRLEFLANDMWPGFWLWGYPFTALAVAAIPAVLLLHERDREFGRLGLTAPLLALLCAWLQPWQGATLVLVLLATEVFAWTRWRSRPPLAPLLVTVGAAALPLVYYAALGRLDPSWQLAQQGNEIEWPLWVLAAALAPLALPALLAYRRPAAGFADLALRAWPPVALGVYLLISTAEVGTFAPHALQGIGIPLSILAVSGVAALGMPPRRVGLAALALVTVAVAVPLGLRLRDARASTYLDGTPFFLEAGERDALRELERSDEPGGVLTPLYLGQLVPALADRRTWVGALSWSPDFYGRGGLANALFDGRLESERARELVRVSGARFLLSDCRGRADLTDQLGPLFVSVRRFGCATLYTVG